jgi:hypothetical protein
MDARVAKLEASVEHIQHDVKELRVDVREIRSKIDHHFLVLSGMVIASSLGLAGIIAKGFHWL